MAHTPHDALFHFTFGKVDHARAALAELLPKHVVKHVDLSSLALDNGHFVDPDLARSETDLLFSAQIAGRPGKIYVLFEHMSGSERFMVLRLLGYVQAIWQDILAQNPECTKLPVIIPLVLHHGPSGWTSAVRMDELLDIDEDGLADLSDYVPRFGMVLQDISAVENDDLAKRAMTALGRITLLLFRHAQTAKNARELFAHLARYVQLVRDVLSSPNGTRAFAAVVRYVQSVTKQSNHEVRMAMQQSNVLLIDEDTYWDIRTPGWREDRALEKGLEKGLKKGREEGQRAFLKKQLVARFGSVPAWASARVEAATIKQLERMSIKILGAQTIEDVVGTEKPKTTKKRTK